MSLSIILPTRCPSGYLSTKNGLQIPRDEKACWRLCHQWEHTSLWRVSRLPGGNRPYCEGRGGLGKLWGGTRHTHTHCSLRGREGFTWYSTWGTNMIFVKVCRRHGDGTQCSHPWVSSWQNLAHNMSFIMVVSPAAEQLGHIGMWSFFLPASWWVGKK